MEALRYRITQAEREFYGENLILLEGAISEFLSCIDMILRRRASLGESVPVCSMQCRIKGADSMRQKLRRQGGQEARTAELTAYLDRIKEAEGCYEM